MKKDNIFSGSMVEAIALQMEENFKEFKAKLPEPPQMEDIVKDLYNPIEDNKTND